MKGLVGLEVQTNNSNKYYLGGLRALIRAIFIPNSKIFVFKKDIKNKEDIVLQFKNGSCIKIMYYNPNDCIRGNRCIYTFNDDLF